jgi:alkyl hydroperoxide reductase subunit AhpC
MTARVGKPAPEFQTRAYAQGEIKSVALADYKGKWVLLYFYPGDFTFV